MHCRLQQLLLLMVIILANACSDDESTGPTVRITPQFTPAATQSTPTPRPRPNSTSTPLLTTPAPGLSSPIPSGVVTPSPSPATPVILGIPASVNQGDPLPISLAVALPAGIKGDGFTVQITQPPLMFSFSYPSSALGCNEGAVACAGNLVVPPPQGLVPGVYSVAVSVSDLLGQVYSASQILTVNPPGTAIPSPTPTAAPTSTPSPVNTPTPSPAPSSSPTPVSSPTPTPPSTRRIVNPDPDQGKQFGYAVAVSGDLVVVGDPQYTTTKLVGRAYLFDARNGELLYTLENPDASLVPSPDQFGSAVAIEGNRVLVGAPNDFDEITVTDEVGKAYLFDATTGALLQTLVNPDPDEFDNFGQSVALAGDRALVGSDDNTGGLRSGTAYLFDISTAALEQTIPNPNPADFDFFSHSLAMEADQLLLGAIGDDTGVSEAGAAYLINADSGMVLRSLLNPMPGSGDRFGWSVALGSGHLLVGAYQDDTLATDAGAAYLFDLASGALRLTINNPNPTQNDNFGSSVAVAENTLLVSAYRDNLGAGAVYLFDGETGVGEKTINNPDPGQSIWFGWSAAISGNWIVVGAPNGTGDVYVFPH